MALQPSGGVLALGEGGRGDPTVVTARVGTGGTGGSWWH